MIVLPAANEVDLSMLEVHISRSSLYGRRETFWSVSAHFRHDPNM